MIQGILIDLGGVIYVGNSPLPGALDALAQLRQLGLPVRYLTNTTRSPKRKLLGQLASMGFDIPEKELFTAPEATRHYLASHNLDPFLLVHPDLLEEFRSIPDEAANAVVIGDAGEYFTYAHMNRAFRILQRGMPLIAMGDNRYFREADGLSLDAGPFVRALEYASGTQAIITGKPAAAFFSAACADMQCKNETVVMIGDDVQADVLGAMDAGLQAILVRTGKYQQQDEAIISGTRALCLDDFPAVVQWLSGQLRG